MAVESTFQTFVQSIKDFWNQLNIKEWAEGIGGSSSDAIQAAVYFGSGFAIGFLFKKYFKFLFACLLISTILILILEYNKVLDIDWEALNVLIGFEPTADAGIILNFVFDWIKAHLLLSISSAVGFLIGYKLG